MREWIAHLSRMSGKSVTARTSMTPQAWLVDVAHELAADRRPDSAARAVAADDVAGPDVDGLARCRGGRAA